MARRIMIVGYGSAGAYALDMLMRDPDLQDCEIVVASRRIDEEVFPRLNTTIISAGLLDNYPSISYVQMDLNDIEHTADILKREDPDIIIYTGRFVSGIKYGAYSYPNNLGYGVWLPLAVPLIYKLCKAVKMAGVESKVINTSYPDGVCPLIYNAGYTNLITGAGNLNHLVPRFKFAMTSDPKNIEVWMVGSHYLNTYVSKEGNPKGSEYYVGWKEDGVFCSSKDDSNIPYILDTFDECKIPMETGHTRNLMIASDAVNITKIILTENNKLVHLPGVNGMIGGYPCRFSSDDKIFYPELPSDISLAEAIKINEQSLRCDGIDDISDGVVTFTDEVIKKMKDIFNIDYPKLLRLEDMEGFAIDHIVPAMRKYDSLRG